LAVLTAAYSLAAGHSSVASDTAVQLAVAAAAKSAPVVPRSVAGGVPTALSPDLVETAGRRLVLYGRPYRFVGVNAYELATDWGVNAGCGPMLSNAQLDAFFGSLPPNTLIRFWAFQGALATNVHTGQLDFAGIDRVVDAATRYGQRLIFVLSDQGGTCDGGHWQNPAWYLGGFRRVYNTPSNSAGQGLDPLSYWQYMQDIVVRYRDSPAVAMWEPMSEAEASTCPAQYEPNNCSGNQICPDEHAAAVALRHFFDVVGGEIHRLDPNHLVESGLLGGGQCGTEGADYAFVSASPGVDVLSVHDYYPASQPLGGDRWNGLAVRFNQARQLGKPIIVGELGVAADPVGAKQCPSLVKRAQDVRAKLAATFAAGSSGTLIWDWLAAPSATGCSLDTYPGDPLLKMLGAEVSYAA
jgi:hypothetical protein